MPFIVTGTSAGGATKAERPDARSAYETAIEMQRANYSDVSATTPDGNTCTLEDLADLARQESAASE